MHPRQRLARRTRAAPAVRGRQGQASGSATGIDGGSRGRAWLAASGATILEMDRDDPFCDRVASRFPKLAPIRLAEHRTDQSGDTLPHVFMADVARWYLERQRAGDVATVHTFAAWLDNRVSRCLALHPRADYRVVRGESPLVPQSRWSRETGDPWTGPSGRPAGHVGLATALAAGPVNR